MDIDLDLSVCVVTRNRAESILTLLHSLHDYADPVAFEAIVVDNHSEDDTAESVVREYPEIILYENPAQEPFIKARNRAIELARGRYVALIAENAVIQPQCLLRLLSFLDKNPEVGIAGPKMIDPDSGVIQASGRSFPTVLSLLFTTFSRIRLFSNSFWIQKYLLQNWDQGMN